MFSVNNERLDDKRFAEILDDCEKAFTARASQGGKYSSGETFWVNAFPSLMCFGGVS